MNVITLGFPRERDASSLISALTPDGRFATNDQLLQWIDAVNRQYPIHIECQPIGCLDGWHMQNRPLRLSHRSGKFFSIAGVRVRTNFGPVSEWDQPIVDQPEIGILGIVTKVFDKVRYYLMQCKVEPGNINGAQLSPTLQATRSNYSRVHGGKLPAYMEYFTGQAPVRVLIDQLQSEQGSRFLRKRNRNMIVEPQGEVYTGEEFRWMTLGQIKTLLRRDNLVNMDARSVLSTIPLPTWDVEMLGSTLTSFGADLVESARSHVQTARSTHDILNWFSHMRATYDREVERRGLDELNNWEVNDLEIRHRDGDHFSVIGVGVRIGNREVNSWSQPLIQHPGHGLNGLIVQKVNGVLHFLIRACMYPGSRDIFELGPTVSRSDYRHQFGKPSTPAYLDLFRDPAPETIRFSSIQSEEGGRFYHYQNHYIILEISEGSIGKPEDGYCWLSLGQIQDLFPHGYFNMEARNLLACLHLM